MTRASCGGCEARTVCVFDPHIDHEHFDHGARRHASGNHETEPSGWEARPPARRCLRKLVHCTCARWSALHSALTSSPWRRASHTRSRALPTRTDDDRCQCHERRKPTVKSLLVNLLEPTVHIFFVTRGFPDVSRNGILLVHVHKFLQRVHVCTPGPAAAATIKPGPDLSLRRQSS